MKPGATAQPDASSSTIAAQVRTDLADHTVGDRDVGQPAGRAAPVDDRSAADDDVSRHRSSLSIDHELQRLPSGSRTYTLDAGAGDRLARSTGPSTISAPAWSSSACSAAGEPSHTKQRSPHGGCAAGARSVNPALPERGPVEVDHLVADVDRHHARVLRDVAIRARGRTPASRRCPASGARHGRSRGSRRRVQDSSAKPYNRAQLVAVILRRSAAGRVPNASSIARSELGNVLSVCG